MHAADPLASALGDVLQFGLAKERWAATHLGEDTVRMVVVGQWLRILPPASRRSGAH